MFNAFTKRNIYKTCFGYVFLLTVNSTEFRLVSTKSNIRRSHYSKIVCYIARGYSHIIYITN